MMHPFRQPLRPPMTPNKVTEPQIKYLEALFIDCGYTDRVQRNAYVERVVGREIKFLDQLTSAEGSRLINLLKAHKTELKERCLHVRLNEDGVCYGCGRDCSGIY